MNNTMKTMKARQPQTIQGRPQIDTTMSSGVNKMSVCQMNLLNEMVFKVQRIRKEANKIKERVGCEASLLSERKVVDLKNVKREIDMKYNEVEQALRDSLLVVNKRTAQIEDMEYELKYKQARGVPMTKEQIEKMDANIKMLDKPMSVDVVDTREMKFRVVVEREGSQIRALDGALFDGDTYTFDDNNGKQKLKYNARSTNPHSIDLISENCKLESIIEQYREENERLKVQMAEWRSSNGKVFDMMGIIRDGFEDIKMRIENSIVSFINISVISKLSDAIESKEENFLRESMKEFVHLISNAAMRINELESLLKSKEEDVLTLKKDNELLDFELKDVMRSAHMICNPDMDHPVNLYQMKLELRNKLKHIQEYSVYLDVVVLCNT